MRRSSSSSPGNVRLLLGRDRVDVPGVRERRQPDLELARPLQELEQQESRPGLALLLDDVVERADPVDRLLLVDVGQLVLELVEVHLGARLRSTVMRAPPGGSCRGRRPRASTAGSTSAGTSRGGPRCRPRSTPGPWRARARTGTRRPATWTAAGPASVAVASRYQRALGSVDGADVDRAVVLRDPDDGAVLGPGR